MDLDGLVVIAVAGLWIAYLVPHHLRHRQQLLDARADDRFSEHLRVLRIAEVARVTATLARSTAVPPERVLLHPARRREDGSMHRPHAASDRASADAARRSSAARAARAASLARRAAAARRRSLLAVLLLLATATGWGAVALGAAGLLLGAVPSVLLVAVLGLGRRAVVSGRRADVAWEAGDVAAPLTPSARTADRSDLPAARHPAGRPTTARTISARPAGTTSAPTVVGRAVHPSDAVTELITSAGDRVSAAPARVTPSLRVEVSGEVAASPQTDVDDRDALADSGVGTWVPVPVPPPAYTLKPTVRRQEPAPLPVPELAASPAAAFVADAEEPRPTTGGLALDAILARRRAAGE